MNEHDRSTDGAESEWLAQEAALRREREGRDPATDTPLIRRYRIVARTLLRPLEARLPGNFAWQAAELVRAAAGEWSAGERRFRRQVLAAATVTVAVLTTTLVALYGTEWIIPEGIRSATATRLAALAVAAVAVAGLLGRRKPLR